MSRDHKRILLFSSALSFFLVSGLVYAQTIPGGVAITSNGIIDLLQSIAGFLIIAGTVMAGISIIYSGVSYVLAGSDVSRAKGAKDALKAGLIGSAIIFASGTIIRMITGFAGNPLGFF